MKAQMQLSSLKKVQMRGGNIRFGIYACSPEESSFRARFTNMELGECKWLAHDGQAPDET